MKQKIFPGNYVNHLSSYQGQPVVAIPGFRFVHLIGYAKVDGTRAKSWTSLSPAPTSASTTSPGRILSA
jgi:hypothetical protein